MKNDADSVHILETGDVSLPRRARDVNKYDCGRVLVVGGSVGYTGAPVLCAAGALRAGAGLVWAAVPQVIYPIAAGKLLEAMVKRGDIYYADLSPVVGSEQGGMRPVLIVQNDTGNKHSPTVIAAAITSQLGKAKLPTHIELSAQSVGLSRDSVILLEQIRTIDKSRLREKMGRLDEDTMTKVDNAIAVSFGLE